MGEMRRKIDKELMDWKNRAHKPLMVFGARQTGKTTSLLEFGRAHYDQVVHVDFYKQAFAKSAFQFDLTPGAVVESLEALLDVEIVPGKTLLFLDEIQACDEALTALKFFCTDAPEYDIVAAGSLLGAHVARQGSYPVGYVDMLSMGPMDFEEFCWAMGKERAFGLVRKSFDRFTPCAVHDQMMELYRSYLLVGGMPEVVAKYSEGARLDEVREKQDELSVAYVADMAKYATSADTVKIVACWESLPEQLAKESGSTKFVWRYVASGAKAERYQTAVDWLAAAGLVNRCTQVSEGVAPLRSFESASSFKLYALDTGLLSSWYRAEPGDFDDGGRRSARFRGGVAENYVMQQLAAARAAAYYWGAQSTYEVEFVVRIGDDIVPVEVKSGERVRSTSAKRFAEKYRCPYIVHVTAKNFRATDAVKSVPLYAAVLLGEQCQKRPLLAG